MTAFVLGGLALATVTLSFAFAAYAFTTARRPEGLGPPRDGETPADTMQRIIAEVERLAVLRDRGALTEKEFAAQKAKVLGTPAPARARQSS